MSASRSDQSSRLSVVGVLTVGLLLALTSESQADEPADEPVGSAYLRGLTAKAPPFGRQLEDRFSYEGVRIQRWRRDQAPEVDWLTVWIDLSMPGLDYRVSPVHYSPGPAGIPIQTSNTQTTLDFLVERSEAPRVELAVNTVAYWPCPAYEGMPVFLSESVWQQDDRPEPRNPERPLLALFPGKAVIAKAATLRPLQPVCAFEAFDETPGPAGGVAVRDGEAVGVGEKPHGRTAAGIMSDGRVLVLLVADCYNPGVSVGMSQADVGRVLQAAGAEQAIFLDGGGSSTLVGRETNGQAKVMNRPAGMINTPGCLRDIAGSLGFTGLRRTEEPFPALEDWELPPLQMAWIKTLHWCHTHRVQTGLLVAGVLGLLSLAGWARWRRRRAAGRPVSPSPDAQV